MCRQTSLCPFRAMCFMTADGRSDITRPIHHLTHSTAPILRSPTRPAQIARTRPRGLSSETQTTHTEAPCGLRVLAPSMQPSQTRILARPTPSASPTPHTHAIAASASGWEAGGGRSGTDGMP
ncbi:hypothetical protein BD413DRAFT_262306 [Trametes elegans]|nr:hypothetical protein BD413DRAFT_262306 [Trametes elegans]